MRWLAYMTRIRMGTFSTIGTPFFFRLSNAKMMFRLIFIIGCVWNSTPKYTPNIWNSKRYSERFRFTMYSKLCVIISNLQFYDISWMYRFESLSLRWKELQNKENPCKLILYGDFLFLVHGKNKHIKAFFRCTIRCTWSYAYICDILMLSKKIKNFSKKTTTFLKKNRNFFKNVLVFFIVTNAS